MDGKVPITLDDKLDMDNPDIYNLKIVSLY